MDKRRGLLGMLVILTCVLVITGCGNKESSQNVDATSQDKKSQDGKKFKFALCISHQQNEFVINLANSVKSAAKSLNIDLIVNDAGQNANKQVRQVESMIAQHIDGIILEPVSQDGLQPAVEAAKNAHIPLITLDQRVSNQNVASAYVGVDHQEGGRLEMEYVAKVLNGQGNIVILHGPMGSDAQVGRANGYKEVLAKNPGIKVVAEQSANWVRADALSIVGIWIESGKKIDAIVSQNDDMALGALKAVEDAQMLDKIKVFGVDATPDGLKSVQAGKMAATISQNLEKQGIFVVKSMYAILKGETVDKEILINHVVITKENIGDFLK